jgi:polyisoprenoid-binding protein YceI
MKFASLASAVLVLAAPVMMAQSSTWKSDPAHSEVDFTVRHMGISNVHGRFGAVNATVVYDDQDMTKSTVNATINVAGIDTGVTPRDNDLKSAHFFDVANYPNATFTSTSVKKGGSGLLVYGNLMVKRCHQACCARCRRPNSAGNGNGQEAAQGIFGDDDAASPGLRRGHRHADRSRGG